MGDTTPPDFSAFGYNRELNPPLKAPEFVNRLNQYGLLGPQTALVFTAIQELGDCANESKAAQWAFYTHPSGRLKMGFLFKASKNGMTSPDTMLGCVHKWLSPGPRATALQFCHSMGQYIDSATGDTVYVGYFANDDALCGLFTGELANSNYSRYY